MQKTSLEHIGYSRRFWLLDQYEAAVSDELPSSLPRFWSISRTDAFTMGRFLDILETEVFVLDIGTFMGISAFWFATQPTVSRVMSVDPNPRIADEVLDKEDVSNFYADYDSLKDVRVLDIADAALQGFDARNRIDLVEGVVGVEQVGIHGAVMDSARRVEVPSLTNPNELTLVAFVDGLHTSDGVLEDLRGIFSRSPRAIAFLHDCRSAWAPSVIEGIERFREETVGEYKFRLMPPPAPGMGQPNLGLLYSGESSAEVTRVIDRMSSVTGLLGSLATGEVRHPVSLGRFVLSPRVRGRIAYEVSRVIPGSKQVGDGASGKEPSRL